MPQRNKTDHIKVVVDRPSADRVITVGTRINDVLADTVLANAQEPVRSLVSSVLLKSYCISDTVYVAHAALQTSLCPAVGQRFLLVLRPAIDQQFVVVQHCRTHMYPQ